MFYGSPHIDTIISLFIHIILFFLVSIVFSIVLITIFRKWKVISFSTVLKSNLALYGTLICVYILSFIFGVYILMFSQKNDLPEKILYITFFIILFLIQTFFFSRYFYKHQKDRFIQVYKSLTILIYFSSLVYILICYFPIDNYDKYLTHSKTYTYLPVNNKKTLLDGSTLKIDSAISTIEYFSNKKTVENDLSFTIYFDCKENETKMPSFSFKALDSINEFGGSSSQMKYKELFLKKLDDSIKIIIEEYSEKSTLKNDPILFVKRKTSIKRFP